jgi:4-hydroxybutyrate dehydrogenase/sulfolactaldehyde 3-reductase
MAKLAFIGLGQMGLPMARNLVRGGHSVRGFDIDAAAVHRHLANGGVGTTSPAEAAEEAEFVFTMLPNGSHVRTVLFGKEGVLSTIPSSALYIDMSTIHPLETDALHKEVGEHGNPMLDAPVGRTSVQAEEGTLLIMAGGRKENVDRARPLFSLLGDTIEYCGGPGSGSRMKIVNNFMSTVLNVLTAETLAMADAIGLDRDLAIRILTGTTAGRGHLTTTYPAKVLKGDLSPAFMIDLANKDLGIALDLAGSVPLPLMVGAAARQMYSMARAQGRGRQDWTALYAMLSEIAGGKWKP